MNLKNLSHLRSLQNSISKLRGGVYDLKVHIDTMEHAIRSLDLSKEKSDMLVQEWLKLEIVYAMLCSEGRTVLSDVELTTVDTALNNLEKLLKSILDA